MTREKLNHNPQKQLARLSGLLERRANFVLGVKEGKIRGESLDDTLRLGRIAKRTRERVELLYPRVNLLNTQIAEAEQERERNIIRKKLLQLEDLERDGVIPHDEVERYRSQYSFLNFNPPEATREPKTEKPTPTLQEETSSETEEITTFTVPSFLKEGGLKYRIFTALNGKGAMDSDSFTKAVYGEGGPVNRDRLQKQIPHLNKMLVGDGLIIRNVSRAGEKAKYKIAITEPTVYESNPILPQGIKKGTVRGRIYEFIYRSKTATSAEIANAVFGKNDTDTLQRLHRELHRLNGYLQNSERIQNISEKGKKATYRIIDLTTGEEPKNKTVPTPLVEEISRETEITAVQELNPDDFPNYQKIALEAILAGKVVTQHILAKSIYRVSNANNRDKVVDVIKNLNLKLKEKGYRATNLAARGEIGRYKLVSLSEPTLKEEVDPARVEFVKLIHNFLERNIKLGTTSISIIETLARNESISLEDLTKNAFGKDAHFLRQRVSASISHLNKLISNRGLRIQNISTAKNKDAVYALKRIEEAEQIEIISKEQILAEFAKLEQKVWETGIGTEILEEWRKHYPFLPDIGQNRRKETEEDVRSEILTANEDVLASGAETRSESLPSAADIFSGEVIEIPYVPTEEELRSEQETKILRSVLEEYNKTEQMRFEVIQERIYDPSRITHNRSRRQEYKTFTADEIKSKFSSAIQKLQIEASTPLLRSGWTPEDLKLWEDVEQAIKAFGQGEIKVLLHKIKKTIDQSERRYLESIERSIT